MIRIYFKSSVFNGLLLIFFIIYLASVSGQNFWRQAVPTEKPPEDLIKITWCVINQEELWKCRNFSEAVQDDKITVGYKHFVIECFTAFSKEECIQHLDEGNATFTTLDAGEVFMSGMYNSLVPIAQEAYERNSTQYYAVAVIKKDTLPDVTSLYNLRGKKACFAGVQTYAGWMLPIYTLMKEGGMEIIDCNNHIKNAIAYFGPSCAVNSLSDKYNPIGDNSDKLCQICTGKIPGGRCTNSDPYAGYEGAFNCLLENSGEIAFVKHSTITSLLEGNEYFGVSKSSFELLCKDGTRKPVEEYSICNWGAVESNAIVTSSATSFENRKILQKFLERASRIYQRQNQSYYENTPINPINPNEPNPQFPNQNLPPNDQQFDQYGNLIRNKRQGYNSFSNYNQDRYGQSNNYDNYDQYNDRYNQYNGSDQFNRPIDGFARDPSVLNKNQFGTNIDPYIEEHNFDRNNQNRQQYDNRNFDNRPKNLRNFALFGSKQFGSRPNTLFDDSTQNIVTIPENLQTYSSFLQKSLDVIMGIRKCPIGRMTLCVTSDPELEKCVKMKIALDAKLLKPQMDCYKAHSHINCMQAIRAGTADVAVLDASDVYTAGLSYDLIPFMSEIYNLEDSEYYVVAVAKESDPSTELTYLKGKNTCHGGIYTAAGWVYPMAFLLSNGWIRPYGCNSIRAAAEYFSKSCVPGAISTEYNNDLPYDNMCHLCHGSSFRYCRRDASEDYYGHTGAFRCLVEGGGHVAFVKHTTVTENTGLKKREWWTRDNLNDDYELMCTDGTRKEVNEYKKCNLGKVKSNAIVTRGGYGFNSTEVNAFTDLFLYAQTSYGRKTTNEFSFSMFSSEPPYADLIFQDATTQLKIIPPEKRHYVEYLGRDFMRARRIVDCHAASSTISASFFTLTLSPLFAIFVIKN